MRRTDRQICDFEKIKELLDGCDTIRLGFVDGDVPYVVPLSFGYETLDGAFVFYVHGAKVGRRHTLAASGKPVCVEADVCLGFIEVDGRDQTADYRSFIGTGTIETVEGAEAIHGLELLCAHCGFDSMNCSQTVVNATCVEKITVRDYCAKQRLCR